MTLPNYKHFVYPLLTVLARHPQGILSRDAVEEVAVMVGLTEEQKQLLLPSGTQPTYQNRILWAHDRLKRFGFSAAPKRGFYLITDKGLAFLKAHPKGIEPEEFRNLAMAVHGKSIAELEGTSMEEIQGNPETREDQEPTESGAGAEERIERAMLEWHESVAADLLEQIAQVPPAFFERLVLDVLHAMGYGVTRKEVAHVGRTGDGGIDGVISMDRLGLQKVYVQAKRWENRIGRPEIQAFYGSLAGNRATFGVFITTSDFSRDAQEYAKQVSDTLVLVDGQSLAKLMIEHEVGVSHRTLKLAKIDHDYFEVG